MLLIKVLGITRTFYFDSMIERKFDKQEAGNKRTTNVVCAIKNLIILMRFCGSSRVRTADPLLVRQML